MILREFLTPYRADSYIQSIAGIIKPVGKQSIQLKGLTGSLDAIVASAIQFLNHQFQVFILHDKEEAAYFFNDLQNLHPGKEILFFPTSYKRPYQFEEIENANILMRSEILNRINQRSSSGELIVTYPDALTEKVINKRSLTKNTFILHINENVDIDFLSELLTITISNEQILCTNQASLQSEVGSLMYSLFREKCHIELNSLEMR